MPYRMEWFDPEVFLEYKGVTIYHCYKDDDYNSILTYWYTTDGGFDKEEPEHTKDFDVRTLPTWVEDIRNPIEAAIKAISAAIDMGLITRDGYQGNEEQSA